jgi:hypothetical protein
MTSEIDLRLIGFEVLACGCSSEVGPYGRMLDVSLDEIVEGNGRRLTSAGLLRERWEPEGSTSPSPGKA